jgi:hypothetical protein
MQRLSTCVTVGLIGFGAGGCASDEGSGMPNPGGSAGDVCELRVKLEGAVAQELVWDSSQGCGGGSDATTRSVALGWGGITTPLNFHLTMIWRTSEGGCTADIARFEPKQQDSVGRSYFVSGSGSCGLAAEAAEGGAQGSVAIAPFVFRSTTLYAD